MMYTTAAQIDGGDGADFTPASAPASAPDYSGDDRIARAASANSRDMAARNAMSNTRGQTTGDAYAKQYAAKATPIAAAPRAAAPRVESKPTPATSVPPMLRPTAGGGVGPATVPGRGRVVASPTPTTSHSSGQPTPKASPSVTPSPRATSKSTPGAGTVLKPVIPTYRGW